MGHVALEGDRVVFVFPEHPDAEGNPRRIPWGEAAETDLLLERLARIERQRRPRVVAPVD